MKSAKLHVHLFTETLLKNLLRRPSRLGLPVWMMRQSTKQLSRLFPVPQTVRIESVQMAGYAAEWITPSDCASDQVLFHIHGGAFFLGGLHTHRALVSDIAVYSRCRAIHVDYPLAPEHPFPSALDALYAIYQALLNQGIDAAKIVLSGDSCGGNLALALCLRLKELQQPLPAGLVLLSPWLDLTLSSPSLGFNRLHDALLSIQALKAGIHYYVGKRLATDDPQLSPLLDDLTGLPVSLVQVGSKEILLDDAKRYFQQAKAAGVAVDLQVFPGMWHNFHMFQHWFPEAKDALRKLGDFVKERNG